jgi:hypothetical protein
LNLIPNNGDTGLGSYPSHEDQDRAKIRPGGDLVKEGSAEGNAKLVQELSIHQEELKAQNEELRRAHLDLETLRAKYFELIDLAPLGYITSVPT